MESIERDIGHIEGTLVQHGKRLDSLDAKMDANNEAMTEKLNRILAYQERQKGGARVLLTVGTVAASVFGALAALVMDQLKGTPTP